MTNRDAFWIGVAGTICTALIVLILLAAARAGIRAGNAAQDRIESHEQWQDNAIRSLLNDDLNKVSARTVNDNLLKLWDLHNALDQRVQKLEAGITALETKSAQPAPYRPPAPFNFPTNWHWSPPIWQGVVTNDLNTWPTGIILTVTDVAAVINQVRPR